MVLGIMQPYFFPYLGYYQLILAVERWIVFDVVQYKRRSWMNRNRVLHPKSGWQYITVPVHAPQGTLIKDAMIVNRPAALQRILGQMEHYRGKAPYFSQVRELVIQTFSTTPTDRLCDLNVRSLGAVCGYLGISFHWSVCSEISLGLPPIQHPGQWALEISSALGATRYINLPGGRDIFRRQDWERKGIELSFLNPPAYCYPTGPYAHSENLSILDVLMWNSPSAVSDYLTGTMNVSD